MKRRLALALAFAGTPKVLLLDEPSSGCDSWTRELVRKDIMLKKQSAAVLVSTHHIDDVEVLSDRVWFLNERYLAFNGPLDTLTELGSSSSFNTPTPSHDDVTRIETERLLGKSVCHWAFTLCVHKPSRQTKVQL